MKAKHALTIEELEGMFEAIWLLRAKIVEAKRSGDADAFFLLSRVDRRLTARYNIGRKLFNQRLMAQAKRFGA
jgi:hypothetical protein